MLYENAMKAVNYSLTVRNWLIGCHIVEYEQNGEDKAKYGTRLLEEMAKNIKTKGIKGLYTRTLRSCRIFYNLYPQIRGTVSAKLQQLCIQQNNLLLKDDRIIRGTVSPELQAESYPIAPEVLLSRLSFSHFIELIRMENSLQRLFYVELPEKKILENSIKRELKM